MLSLRRIFWPLFWLSNWLSTVCGASNCLAFWQKNNFMSFRFASAELSQLFEILKYFAALKIVYRLFFGLNLNLEYELFELFYFYFIYLALFHLFRFHIQFLYSIFFYPAFISTFRIHFSFINFHILLSYSPFIFTFHLHLIPFRSRSHYFSSYSFLSILLFTFIPCHPLLERILLLNLLLHPRFPPPKKLHR